MTLLRLLLKNLWHFRKANLAVAAGMAVATAVLAGALMVGDSVRGSLADLAAAGRGPADAGLIARGFFNASLAERIERQSEFAQQGGHAVAGIFVRGGATRANDEPTGLPLHVAGAQIIGLNDWVKVAPGRCVLNGRLADDLGAKVGDRVILNLPQTSSVPLDAPLGRRGRTDVLTGLAVTVERIDRGGMESMFSLTPSQRTPRNAWVNLADLADAIKQRGRANLLLGRSETAGRSGQAADSSPAFAGPQLAQWAFDAATLDDFGIEVAESPATQPDNGRRKMVLTSRDTYLPNSLTVFTTYDSHGTAESADLDVDSEDNVTVNLALELQREAAPGRPAKAIHYAMVAAIGRPLEMRPDGVKVSLNQWAADQLNAQVGDRIRFSYYKFEDGQLHETWSNGRPAASSPESQPRAAVPHSQPASGGGVELKVEQILPMTGLGADPSLVPSFEGLTDKTSIADWQPPAGVRFDRKLVTPADEEYWKRYRAAPKMFIDYNAAQKLWGDDPDRFVTSIRLSGDSGEMQAALTAVKSHFKDSFFVPVFGQIEATDFAGLFIGFSFFLIVSAVMLAALLFRLNIEQRSRQIGLLGALGFSPRRLARLHLAEGAVLAAVGGAAGVAGAAGYAWLMMVGLRTWWIGATGTTAMRLHVEPTTLVIGFAAGVAVALIAVAWTVRWVAQCEAAKLLAGGVGMWDSRPRLSAGREAAGTRPAAASTAEGGCATTAERGDSRVLWSAGAAERQRRRFGWRRWAALFLALLAAGLFIAPLLGRSSGEAGAYASLSAGAILLVAFLLWLAGRWRSWLFVSQRRPGGMWHSRPRLWAGPAATIRLGLRNAARHPTRSVLTVGLLAFASFILVVVASMRQTRFADTADKRSGAGGYSLILTADVPLSGDLNTPAGRRLLGVRNADDPLWSKAKFTMLHRHVGRDVSCLNMALPPSASGGADKNARVIDATVIGVPQSMIDRGGFTFVGTIVSRSNPWEVLYYDILVRDYPPDSPVRRFLVNIGLLSEREPEWRRISGGFFHGPSIIDPTVIADDATAQYTLHLHLGQDFQLAGPKPASSDSGTFCLAATLSNSIFQSELLVDDFWFRELYPADTGYGMVLIEAPAEDVAELRHRLIAELGDFGVSVETSADRLAAYAEVANTYLSTFQALGSLGLLLGSAGLAVVLLRTLIERRSELALLAAIGFTPGRRLTLVLAENVYLLALGLLAGVAAAAVGVAPTVASGARSLNVAALAGMLAAVAGFALAVLAAAAWRAGRSFTPADLRRE